jgi:branched-chain amino acid transport system substrate-binding protein
MTKRLVLLALVGALAVVPVRAADSPVEIPVIASVTGPSAFYGSAVARGFGFLEADLNKHGGINGRPVHFAISDDQTNPQVTNQLASQAVARGAQIIIHGGAGASCLAAGSTLKPDGPVLYCMTSVVHPPPGSYMFATAPLLIDQYNIILRYLRGRGVAKLGLLSTTDTTGLESEKEINDLVKLPENKSLSIVAQERMALGDLSVTAQIERIKSAGAQAIIAGTSGTAFQTMLRGMRDAGLELPVAASAGNLSYRQMEAFAPSMPKGDVLITGFPVYARDVITTPALRGVVDRFLEQLKTNDITKPEIGYVTSWDTGSIVVDAVRRRGTGATATQLRGYIANLRGLTGLFGTLDFKISPQNGTTKDWVFVLRWDAAGDRFVAVSKPGGEPLARYAVK